MQESFAICLELIREFRESIHNITEDLAVSHVKERVRLHNLHVNYRKKCKEVSLRYLHGKELSFIYPLF